MYTCYVKYVNTSLDMPNYTVEGRHHFVRLHLRLCHPGHGAQRARADAETPRDAASAEGCDWFHDDLV